MRRVAFAVVTAFIVFLSFPSQARADDAPFIRPVEGKVLRAFNPPVTPFGPGHLGVDFAVPDGAAVRAGNDGTVTFAGQVGGQLHVVVAHSNQLRTSYSFVKEIRVQVGDRVRRGEVIATAGSTDPEHRGSIHWGARMGDRYIDPMPLLEPTDLTELVRLAEATSQPAKGINPGMETSIDSEIFGDPSGYPSDFFRKIGIAPKSKQGWWEKLTGAAVSGKRFLVGVQQSFQRIAVDRFARVGDWLTRTEPVLRTVRETAEVASRVGDWLANRFNCQRNPAPADGTPLSSNLVIGIAGITSKMKRGKSPWGNRDPIRKLGYPEDRVDYFSYGDASDRYESEDTFGDLRNQAVKLGKQIRATGKGPVDLVAHSQGGVVALEYLKHVYDPNVDPPIDNVILFAAPVEGTPLATAGDGLRRDPIDRLIAGAIAQQSDGSVPSPSAKAVRQMSEDSDFTWRLKTDPLPKGVSVTSISTAFDAVVPPTNTDVRGGREITVNSGGLNEHSEIIADPTALAAARAAIEGKPPPCISVADGIKGAIAPVVISRGERELRNWLALPGVP